VRYPFGHGLSYTTFAYENLQLELVEDDNNNSIVVDVSFQLTNTGSVTGKEVAQCYVHDVHASVYRPTQELRDFTKVELAPGESRTLKMRLTAAAFSFYDIGVLDWVVEKGVFEIRIGSSSRDIRLRGQIDIQKGAGEVSELARISYPPVDEGGVICPMDDVSFSQRFGKSSGFALADLTPVESDGFHRNTLLKEISGKRLIGRILLAVVSREASRDVVPGPARNRQLKMVKANVENLPLRVLVLFSKGNFTFELLDALLSLMNGEFFTALRGFGRGFVGMFRRR
jgi:beta-glucosidase